MKTAEVDRIFRKLEMKVRNGKDQHAWLIEDGKYILHTMRSHGRGDIGRIAHFIRQQLKVNEEQFAGLRDCPLSRSGYIDLLRSKGLV